MESPGKYQICLPQGKWYDYWSGTEVKQAAPLAAVAPEDATTYQIVESVPELGKLPVFVRAGAILPRQPLVQSTAETPRGSLSLEIYPGEDCRGTLYADDGHSMAYARGGYLRQTVRCAVTERGLTVSFDARAGTFQPWWKSLDIVVHGWDGGARATLAGSDVASKPQQAHELHLVIADQVGAAELVITRP
jgi:alpha-glucosidase